MGRDNKKSNSTKNVLVIFLLLSSSFLYPSQSIALAQGGSSSGNFTNPCRCVIFRLDDIQVGYLDHVQEQIIDTFQKKHASISIGIIGNDFDNDKVVLPYLKQKLEENISQIEIANHGWMHEDFSRYNATRQAELMKKTDDEISSLFGIHPVVFIPPFNKFNGDTLVSAHQLGFKIFSSSVYFDSNNYFTSGRETTHPSYSQLVYHVPAMVDFAAISSGSWVRIPNQQIIDVAEKDMARYGYSVILLHPENFARFEGQSYIDVIDPNQINDLSNLIDSFRAKNMQVTTFANLVGLKTSTVSAVPEFGSMAELILVIAVVSVIAISVRKIDSAARNIQESGSTGI